MWLFCHQAIPIWDLSRVPLRHKHPKSLWLSVFFKAFQRFLRVVHVSHIISLTLHSPSWIWMLARSHFCSRSLCLRTTNTGSTCSSVCSFDHDTFYIWGRWEILLIFFFPYGDQRHTVLFPNDWQRNKTERETETKTGREREAGREEKEVFQVLVSCNSFSSMSSNP